MSKVNFDLIIIGAGIAGLWSGIQALRKGRKDLRVLILEKYKYIGGRIVTHYKKGLQWEIGAGRIHQSHSRVRALMKKFGLTWVPMDGKSNWRDSANPVNEKDIFPDLYELYISPLMFLPANELACNTLYSCMIKVHGQAKADDICEKFPYWSELKTIRADLALGSFQHEMREWDGFGACREGLTAIIRELTAEFEALGGHIFYKDPAVDIRKRGDIVEILLYDDKVFTCKSCLLATHRDAIAEMPSLQKWEMLSKVKMDPLLRMYAVFPVVGGKSWFSDISKTITDSKVRFIIPVNPSKGVLMISYTDGDDARYWIDKMKKTKDRDGCINEVMKEIRELFPEKSIPNPKDFHMYPWHSGCSYWLPGDYDPVIESKKAHIIDKGIFCCGESFSLRQAWIEGALENAEELFKVDAFLKSIS